VIKKYNGAGCLSCRAAPQSHGKNRHTSLLTAQGDETVLPHLFDVLVMVLELSVKDWFLDQFYT
jgi:hypothetical protein